jgi:hypothetical protein
MIGAKKGAHGGNMVSPVLNREDALIMWKDPIPADEVERRG